MYIFLICRISETARERRKSQEQSRKPSTDTDSGVNVDQLLEDGNSAAEEPEDGNTAAEESEEPEHELVNNIEEDIPIEIPFDDVVPNSVTNGEVETKNEPIEVGDIMERVPAPVVESRASLKSPEDDRALDSMDRLRRDLEKLANKGRTSNTESRPLRKTGGAEADLGEVRVPSLT